LSSTLFGKDNLQGSTSTAHRQQLQSAESKQHYIPLADRLDWTELVLSDAARHASYSMVRSTVTRPATYRAISSLPFDTLGFSPSFPSRVQSTNRNYFSTKAKIPTPTPPPNSKQSTLIPNVADAQKLALQGLKISMSAIQAILTFFLKLPGNSWYYLTHSQERRERIAGIREMAKKEFDHYWMGTKVWKLVIF
jgi:hypothetical protein